MCGVAQKGRLAIMILINKQSMRELNDTKVLVPVTKGVRVTKALVLSTSAVQSTI